MLIALAIPLARVALKFGPAEYFSLGVFGLAVVSSLAGKSWLKGFFSVTFGLVIATIGFDPISGITRYTYLPQLLDGISFIPALIGLFAISEVLAQAETMGEVVPTFRKMSGALPTLAEINSLWVCMIRATVIGFVVGVIPGSGKAVGSFIAYNEERRASKHPELFGTGVLAGVAAPEAANNSVVSGALVPMLTLGIPGSGTTAILIGAMMIQGVQPGPLLFTNRPDLIYGLFASLLVGNVVMLIMGLAGTQVWVKMVSLPKGILNPLVLAVCLLASYGSGNNLFDVGVSIVFGVIGYVLRKYDFPVAPIVLALVLGQMIETNFRRALLTAGGSPLTFLMHPISAFMIALALFSFIYSVRRDMKAKKGEVVLTKEEI
jgi:putative tricarboxylic transport membrane protein